MGLVWAFLFKIFHQSPETVVFCLKSILEAASLPLLTCLGSESCFNTEAVTPFVFSIFAHSFWNAQVPGCFPLNSAENAGTADLCDRATGDKLPCHFNQSHPHLSLGLSRVKLFITHQPSCQGWLFFLISCHNCCRLEAGMEAPAGSSDGFILGAADSAETENKWGHELVGLQFTGTMRFVKLRVCLNEIIQQFSSPSASYIS